ncbi:MAG: PAS domain-containing protein [Pyrinomonadaceae bacterium]
MSDNSHGASGARLHVAVEQCELQAEELRASNEKLRAINEELQSANEELVTVNQELRGRIDELDRTNKDIRNLINSTDIGTIYLDRALRINLFTPRAFDLFNLMPEDIGRALTDITTKLVDEDLLADAERVRDTNDAVEREVFTHEGRWYLMRLAPCHMADDRINGVVLTFLDITGRKRQAEETRGLASRLEQQTRVFNTTLSSINDFAYLFDGDGRFIYANQSLLDLLGITLEEIVGKNFFDLKYPDDLAARLQKQIGQVFDTKTIVRDETPFTSPTGAGGFYEYIFTPVFAADGTTVEVVAGSTRDVTGHKQIELKLQRAHEELERRVEERTHELAESNRSLRDEVVEREQSEAARERLIRRLVTTQEDERRRIARDLHDHLGQQLTGLRLKLTILKENSGKDEKLCEGLEQAQALAARLDSDVDFLAWELRPAALDDCGLATALLKYVKEWSHHFQIKAEFHTSSLMNERFASAIETNLYRIAQESLNNTFKHAQATRAEVLLERRGQHVVLIIEDDGVGFDAGEPLSLDPQAEGTSDRGLGLLGMRERAALVGGTIQIESEPGAGTTIFACVPVTPAKSYT